MDPRDLPDPDLKSPLDVVLWVLQVLASNPDLTPLGLVEMFWDPELFATQAEEVTAYVGTFESSIGTPPPPSKPAERAEFWAELEAKVAADFMSEMLSTGFSAWTRIELVD